MGRNDIPCPYCAGTGRLPVARLWMRRWPQHGVSGIRGGVLAPRDYGPLREIPGPPPGATKPCVCRLTPRANANYPR